MSKVEEYNLVDITSGIHTGLNPRKNFKLNTLDAKFYYVTVKEIASNKVIFSENTDRINSDAWNVIQNRSHLSKGDILFSGIGTIGKVAYVNEDPKNWNCSESVYVIKPFNGLSGKYLYYVLQTNKIIKQYEANSAGSIMKGVRKANLEQLRIPLPHIKVQEEIVKILDSFTNLIDALNEELSLRQKQFEYYREKLLTFDDKIEFDTIKLVHIYDICNVSRGASPRPIKNYLTQSEEGVPWIKIGDVTPFDKYIKKTNERITKEGAKKSRFLHKGDLILSNSLSFGRPYILEIDGCIHDGWISLSGFENYVLRDFLYEVLNTKSVQNYWTMKANNGGAMSNLNSDIVKSTIIKIPSIKVQEDIVKILDSFTNLISSLKEEIALRQKQYEYYREKLLTFD